MSRRRQRPLDGPVRGVVLGAPLIVGLWLVIIAAVLVIVRAVA